MLESFKNHLEQVVAERRMPGVAALVARNGEVLFEGGVGFADVAAQRPVTPDTIFGIGSLTKSFTAMAIMQLVDRGKLKVTDLVVDYFPALAGSSNKDYAKIQVHHLLTNSSGLPPLPYLTNALARSVLADPNRELLGVKDDEQPEPMDTTDEIVQAIADDAPPLLREPGVIFSYCNDGFAMLGRIIELVSGVGYEEFVKANILEPLGMTRSVFDPRELGALGDVTELYSYIDGFERVEHTPGWWEAPAMTAAGFLKSTVRDLLRYADVYLGKRPDVLSPESLAAMSTAHAHTVAGGHYGYGMMVRDDHHGHKVVEHGGNIKGVGTWLTTFPNDGVVSVILSNITGGPVIELALAGANAAVGLPLDARRDELPTVELGADKVRPLLGTYRSAEDSEVTIKESDGGVTAVVAGKELGTRIVGEACVVIDSNGADAVMEFIDPGEGGFGAAKFGFRVLERVAEPTPGQAA